MVTGAIATVIVLFIVIAVAAGGSNAPNPGGIAVAASATAGAEGGSAGHCVSDDSGLNITGSIEMRAALRLTDWQGGTLACKWDGGAVGCWLWLLNDDGTLTFAWSDSSASYHSVTSTQPLPFNGGALVTIK